MGNSHPKTDCCQNKKKDKKSKRKTENSNQTLNHIVIEAEEEIASVVIVVKIIFEMKHGSTTDPETLHVNPLITLGEWKEDLKQLRNIQTVGVRRSNENADLGPDNQTLEDLHMNDGDEFKFRDCA